MKTIFNGALKLIIICYAILAFQTCKKESQIQPQASEENIALQSPQQFSLSSSYVVSTLVSGLNSNNLPKVQFPYHICSAADGTLYVSSPNAGVLTYKITQQGKVSKLPNLDGPYGIKAGANGSVYLTCITFSSDIGSIVKIDKNNVVTTIPSSVTFANPADLAIAPDSTIYVADELNNRIVKITKQGNTTIFAGKTGQIGLVDGQGGNARFSYPSNIRYANDGILWVVDGNGVSTGGQTIRKITLDGKVTTFFKLAPSQQSFINDLAVTNRDKNFNISPHENAFISITRSSPSDTSSLTQRKYQILHLSYDKVLTPITSLLTEGFQDGPAAQATFRGPTGLTVNPGGIFVADLSNNAIRKITRK